MPIKRANYNHPNIDQTTINKIRNMGNDPISHDRSFIDEFEENQDLLENDDENLDEEDVNFKEKIEEQKIISNPYRKDDNSIRPNTQNFFKQPNKQTKNNPLKKYFRKPSIYIRLPSNGYFSDHIEFTPTGEVPVFPMTAKDEIWLKTPEALLNGDAIKNVIESCCPAVGDISTLPINDINVLLLAVRYSSFGKELVLTKKCPHCKTDNHFGVDIEEILSQISFLEKEYELTLEDGMILKIKPHDYQSMVQAATVSFEEAKILSVYENNEFDEDEKRDAIKESFVRINNLVLYLLSNSILKIITPEGETVTNKDFILEWLQDIDRKSFKLLKDKIEEINAIGVPKDWLITCINESCKKEISVEIIYDPASFFV